jgi:hypothetical protein
MIELVILSEVWPDPGQTQSKDLRLLLCDSIGWMLVPTGDHSPPIREMSDFVLFTSVEGEARDPPTF